MQVVGPVAASAQEPIPVPLAWREGLSTLTTALAGVSRDDAGTIGQALETMSRALADWDRAIQAFETHTRSSLEAAPAAAAVRMRIALAVTYANRGRLRDALQELEAATRLDPRHAEAHLFRGLVLEALARPDDAAAALHTAWSLDRADPVKAYHLLRSGTVAETTARPGARETLETLYRSLRDTGGVAKAQFVVLQGAGDDEHETILPLAAYAEPFALIARGAYDEAIPAFRTSVAADPLSIGEASEPHRFAGLAAWVDGNYESSIRQLESAGRMNPRDERSRLALAGVLTAAGRDAEAVRTLEQTVRAFPLSALAHWSLGQYYERVNRVADARQEYTLAAAGAAGRRDRLDVALGRLAAGAADGTAAVAALGRAVAANPNDPGVHKTLAGVLLQQDRPDDAFAELVAAVWLDPGDADAHASIGQIYLDAGRYADAVASLRRTLDLSPSEWTARYALATALMRLGQTQAAGREFERVAQEQRQATAERRRTMSADVNRHAPAPRNLEGDPGK